jgi:hypothetical protein
MISLTCTSCKRVLQIDDAFAGGVCRCQHCGTIQTVPANLRRGARPAAPASGTGAKTLYQKKTRSSAGDTKSGTGLDDLASAVASSSGLSRGGLRSSRAAQPPSSAPTAPTKPELWPIFVVGGAVIVTLLIVILFLTLRSPNATASASGSGPAAKAAPIPRFVDVTLDVPSVVYVIDRGDGTREVFGELKEATLKSIETLGPDRRFQIIFWNNGSEAAFPPSRPAAASAENLAAARRALDEITAFGQTDLKPSLERAVMERPGAVVIATAKGWDLDAAFVSMASDVVGGSGVKVHCFAVGDGGASKPLQTVAQRTGGEYRELQPADLRSFAQ